MTNKSALVEQLEERAIKSLQWFLDGKPTQGVDVLGQADILLRCAAALRALAGE